MLFQSKFQRMPIREIDQREAACLRRWGLGAQEPCRIYCPSHNSLSTTSRVCGASVTTTAYATASPPPQRLRKAPCLSKAMAFNRHRGGNRGPERSESLLRSQPVEGRIPPEGQRGSPAPFSEKKQTPGHRGARASSTHPPQCGPSHCGKLAPGTVVAC